MSIIQAQQNQRSPKKVAIVTALFNEELTKKLEEGAVSYLEKNDMQPMARVYVPGAVEIPIAVQALLEKSDCDAVVALGIVIRGETSHYDYVCNSVERGCSNLQLEYKKPVAFGVLTTENRGQAEARCGGAKGNKGAEAAEVALDMLQVLEGINKL
ncbi:MAG: 6,7-dimethyl-8-ribityllumazine synthase [Bdellovibrionales bacterium]|nr:6,7-dimethyl-8-ribityllumazine synthase [Bdellovibrionales bacterium]NQZ17921.1 6,7-dimethyl-8-ribityllumazine synthase [Bdellovibrionales bacterium]